MAASSSMSTPVPLANLFIKNLHATIDDKALHDMFSSYGAISSAKVVRRDDGRSKQFGFVCFGVNWQAAFLAMANMNGYIVAGKPIYVNIAQKKDQRKKMLAAQFGNSYQEDHEMSEVPENRTPEDLTSETIVIERKRAIVQSLRVAILYPKIADKIEMELVKVREGELYRLLSDSDLLREKIDSIAKMIGTSN